MTMRRATISLAIITAIALMVCAGKRLLLSESSPSVVSSSHFNNSGNNHKDWGQHEDPNDVVNAQLESKAMHPNHAGHDGLRGSLSYQGDNSLIVGNNNTAAEEVNHSADYERTRNLHHLNNMCLSRGPELFVGDPPPYPEILLVNYTTIQITFEMSYKDNVTRGPCFEEMQYFMQTTRKFFIDYMLSPYLQPRPLHEDFDEFTLSLSHCKIKTHERINFNFPLRIAVDATVYYDLGEDPLHRPMTEADVIDAIIDSFQWDDYVKDYLWRDSDEGRDSVWNQIDGVFFAWKVVRENAHSKRTGQ